MIDKTLEIAYDYPGVIVPDDAQARKLGIPVVGRQTGLDQADFDALARSLRNARQDLLKDLQQLNAGRTLREGHPKVPLDAGFIDLPERLLGPERPELERLKAAGQRLATEVDRVVVLGIGGSYMGARALFEACCPPYHNERSRAQRGKRPRLYFEGNNVDNDAVQGLLDLLGRGRRAASMDQRWGIVVISKSGKTLETAVALRVFLDALRGSCGNDGRLLKKRLLMVTERNSRLWNLGGGLGLGADEMFVYPDHVGGRFSILTAVGLLPAAVLGLDVDALLEGAAAMTERFRQAPVGNNPVLDYVGISHLMEARRGANIRVLSTWGSRLEAVGLWYDQLLAESLGKDGQGATPLTVVNTRDLHSRGQQHQDGRRDKLITNLLVREPSQSAVRIKRSDRDEDHLNQLAGKTLPEILSAAIAGTNQAYAEDFRRTTTISLAKLDEVALGQLFQMLMLATAVEGRLIGINPFGQPGVENYKNNMFKILGLK